MVASAIHAFAATGYYATTIATVAEDAGISQAYVCKLFPSKTQLFVAAMDRCFELVEEALAAGAAEADPDGPADALDAMGGAYAELIADRDLLRLQVHALSAVDIPEIRAAMTRGVGRITRFALARSGAPQRDVQAFMATGQLCHLIATLGLESIDEPWARTLDHGIRHPVARSSEDTREGVEA